MNPLLLPLLLTSCCSYIKLIFSTDSVYSDVLLALFADNNFIVLATLLGHDDSKINIISTSYSA